MFVRTLGQPKQIIKTRLGQGDFADSIVDSINETLRNNGCRDTLEEKGRAALDNYFNMSDPRLHQS